MLDLGTVEIVLQDEEIELGLDSIVPISEESIDQDYIAQPSLYAYVAMLAARSEAEWIDCKRALDQTRAEMYKDVRKDLESGPGRVTEAMITAEIELRRGYQDALMIEIEAREQHLIMKALTRAMEMRAQMLISLGAHMRAEYSQTGMNMKDVKDKLRGIRAKASVEKASVDNDAEDRIPF